MATTEGADAITTTYTSSDLQTRRREVIDTARDGRAYIRDTDGMTIAMLPSSELELLTRIRSFATAFITAEAAVATSQSRATAFGELSWFASLDPEDRAECVADLREGFAQMIAGDQGPLDECITAWKTTARQLADPTRRVILLGEADAEYVEVDRPTI